MPQAQLPERPSLEYLKKLAKERLATLRLSHPTTQLAEAQLAVAREYGFPSWRKLKARIESTRQSPEMIPIDTELSARFIAAVREGNLPLTRRLLKTEPRLANDPETRPLSVAAEVNRPAMVSLLLGAGADPASRYDGWGHTPLSWAVTVGAFQAARALIKAGVVPDLFCAAGLGDLERVRACFDEHGQIISGASQTGSSRYAADGSRLPRPSESAVEVVSDAIYIAARNARAAVVAELLKYPHDLGFRAYIGGTPLHWAYFGGSEQIVQMLLRAGADPTSLSDAFRATPRAFGICVAANWGIAVQVKNWLRKAPDLVNIQEANATPLHFAALGGHLDIVRILLAAGADTALLDCEGHTPREVAVTAGHGEIAALLADPNPVQLVTPDPKIANSAWSAEKLPEHRKSHKIVDWKPLMDAAFNGDVKAARRLLDEGADPNVVSTTPRRYRPLHRAIEHKRGYPKTTGHDEVVELLLGRGADPHLRGTYGMLTALQLAALEEPRFIPLLRPRFEPLDIFHAAALGEEGRVVELLNENPSLASARDENQWTALHYCAGSVLHRKSWEMAETLAKIARHLLAAGADLMAAWNFNDEWPLRPLYYACGASNNAAVAEVLLKAGANPCDWESVYHASDEGHTECLALIERYVPAAELAAECTRCLPTQLHWGRTRGMPWLLAHGANPNILHPWTGKNALHEAAGRGAADKVIASLLARGADPMRKTGEGKTAWELVPEKARGKLASLLGG